LIPQIFNFILNPMNIKIPLLSGPSSSNLADPFLNRLPPRSKEDLPDLQYWNRKDYTISDLTSISDDDNQKLGFLEHEDGELFDADDIPEVRQRAREAFESLLINGLDGRVLPPRQQTVFVQS
jgi:hypothetical protein